MLAEYDLKPQPLPSIPDDPPPHEGAMISLPHLVEPPDLVLVEVLEALPGRPISGERLVRPDGKIIDRLLRRRLRQGVDSRAGQGRDYQAPQKILTDESLGLWSHDGRCHVGNPSERPPIPELPAGLRSPFDSKTKAKDKMKPRSSSSRTPSIPAHPRTRSACAAGPAFESTESEPVANRSRFSPGSGSTRAAPNPIMMPVGPQGKVTITIELHGPNAPTAENPQQAPSGSRSDGARRSEWTVVPPAESERVFVDITAYNSKNYLCPRRRLDPRQAALDGERDGAGCPAICGRLDADR